VVPQVFASSYARIKEMDAPQEERRKIPAFNVLAEHPFLFVRKQAILKSSE
jgi:hypothetical protein